MSPSHAASVGVTWQEHLDGVADGVRRAKAATGIEARLIVTALRHEPPEHALGIARRLYEDPHPLVTGFGLAGDEQANPLSGFTAAFELADRRVWAARFMPARSSGPRASARPSTYRSAAWVTASAPSRTTRSSRNWSDRRSCSRSAHRATWRLGSSRPGGPPLPRLRAAGVTVTLNTDDPPHFATTLGTEYALARHVFGFSDEDLLATTRTALNAAFLDDQTRAGLLDQVQPPRSSTVRRDCGESDAAPAAARAER